jgi:hypothetical protein
MIAIVMSVILLAISGAGIALAEARDRPVRRAERLARAAQAN